MSGRQAYDISVEVSGPNRGMLLHSYIGLLPKKKNIVFPLVEDIDFFDYLYLYILIMNPFNTIINSKLFCYKLNRGEIVVAHCLLKLSSNFMILNLTRFLFFYLFLGGKICL